DILPRIVLPFFSTRYDRAGLGLSIASKLMNQMDGRLSIASNVRQGTVVTLQFPIIPKQADIKQIHERKPLPC
ncbi:MAG: ATP-binding protein, partial [Desulfatirhabdiaceae bacterium]